MRGEIRKLQKKVGITSIFVTHDQEEALTIADTVVVINQGRIEQIGSPSEIYDVPRTQFMADFIGISNIFEGILEKDQENRRLRLRTSSGLEILIRDTGPYMPSEALRIALRPENITIYPEPPNEQQMSSDQNVVEAVVENGVRMGPLIQYSVRCETGDRIIVHSQHQSMNRTLRDGDRAWLRWSSAACLLLRE